MLHIIPSGISVQSLDWAVVSPRQVFPDSASTLVWNVIVHIAEVLLLLNTCTSALFIPILVLLTLVPQVIIPLGCLPLALPILGITSCSHMQSKYGDSGQVESVQVPAAGLQQVGLLPRHRRTPGCAIHGSLYTQVGLQAARWTAPHLSLLGNE